MLGWQIGRAGFQALWAIGLAHALGVQGYGTFAGLAGLATAMGALTGLGFGLLMLQRVSRSPADFSTYWGRALSSVVWSALVLGVLYIWIVQWWFRAPAGVLALIAIAVPELLLVPLATVASYAFQAKDRMGWAGAMYALPAVGNVIALIGCIIFVAGAVDFSHYLLWHLCMGLLVAAAALSVVGIILRPEWRPVTVPWDDHTEAMGFLAMRVIDTGLGNLDKSIVLRLGGAELAGHYTAAYRLAALIALPAVSLAISAGPRLFRQAGDSAAQVRLMRRLLGVGVVLGGLGVPLAWGLSWVLPLLFGRDFDHAAELARINCLFPALLGLASLGCTMLMTCGRKRLRSVLQLVALLLLLAVMWVLVPVLQGAGAIMALNLTYLLLVVGLWSALWIPAKE